MIQTTTITDSYYKYYKTPLSGEKNPVPRDMYKRIIAGFVQFIIKKALDGFSVRLAGGRSLGALAIIGKDTIKLNDKGEIVGAPVDAKETKKLWASNPEAKANREFIYHLNEHTNGISYSWLWSTRGMKIANKRLYSLITTKGQNGNGRKITRMIRDHGKEYYVTTKRQFK